MGANSKLGTRNSEPELGTRNSEPELGTRNSEPGTRMLVTPRPSIGRIDMRNETTESLGLGLSEEGDSVSYMAHPADARRRWLGLFCLSMAAGMVTWGIIMFGSSLQGFGFLVYWAVCFLFTIAALL